MQFLPKVTIFCCFDVFFVRPPLIFQVQTKISTIRPVFQRQIEFEGSWGELEARNCFQRQSFTKCLRQNLVSCEIVQFLFFRIFLLVLTKFSFLAESLMNLTLFKIFNSFGIISIQILI